MVVRHKSSCESERQVGRGDISNEGWMFPKTTSVGWKIEISTPTMLGETRVETYRYVLIAHAITHDEVMWPLEPSSLMGTWGSSEVMGAATLKKESIAK